MKLASLKHGRDGRLVVVSHDLTRATDAFIIVPTLQAALDDWSRYGPALADLAEQLQHGSVPSFRFHEQDCASPLPRAYRRVTGMAADSAPAESRSDFFMGPREPADLGSAADLTITASVAAITDDVPMGIPREEAAAAIRLLVLVGDLSGAAGRPLSTALSPVAVTPDTLDDAWEGGRLRLPVLTFLNGRPIEHSGPDARPAADLPALVARAARARPLGAGTLVGADPAAATSAGSGDLVRIEMKDGGGHSVFGAIERRLESAGG